MNSKNILFFTIVLFSSCGYIANERIVNDNFFSNDTLSSNKIGINEIFNPVGMTVLDDYYVFQNEYGNSGDEDFFYVYNAENMSFCYSFGNFGNGRNEFLSPRIVLNNNKNDILIADSRSMKLYKYNIKNKGEEFVEEKKINGLRFPIQEVSLVNDSILLFFVMTNENVFLYSYNYNNEQIVDTLFCKTGFEEKLGEDFLPSHNEYRYSNYKNKYAIVFHYIDELIIGEVDDEGFFKNKNCKLEKKDFVPDKAIYENILYYPHAASSENFIFVQYYGYLFRQLTPFPFNLGKRHFDFLIEVYDWNKNPITVLSLDEEILRIYVDNKRNKLYAWNPLKDFDNLIEYDISYLYK